MMQRKIVDQKIKELEIQEFVEKNLSGVGLSSTQLQVTPMAEKIIINTSRPGLVVGRKGQSIKKMTNLLKKKFNLENPQIEINEVTDVGLDSNIVAERIASTLERFGAGRFKGIGHKTMDEAMRAGALGIEILISGKVPSARARRWRFYQGYLKKCGDIAITGVRKAYKVAQLKTGSVGIQVRIMPGDIKLPDNIKLVSEIEEVVEDITEEEKAKSSAEESKEGTEESEEETTKESGDEPAAESKDEVTRVPKEEATKESEDELTKSIESGETEEVTQKNKTKSKKSKKAKPEKKGKTTEDSDKKD